MEVSSVLLEAIECEHATYDNLPAAIHRQSVALLPIELDLGYGGSSNRISDMTRKLLLCATIPVVMTASHWIG